MRWGSQLAELAGDGDRIAVVDVETTGVYNHDRVVEIAVVTLTTTGEITDEWHTLVNPGRDVGPTRLHGITPAMVEHAPCFDDVAGALALRLEGATLAGHNLPFDARMLGLEYERLDADADLGMGVDTLRVTRTKLEVACSQHGICLDGAHQALHDARATACLLLALAEQLSHAGCAGRAARMPTWLPAHPRVVVRGEHARVPTGAGLDRLARPALDLATVRYHLVLDRMLDDLQLDRAERAELEVLASELGLDETGIVVAHRAYAEAMIDAAIADETVTDAEYEALCRVAAALGVDHEVVERRTRSARSMASDFVLAPGTRVCFTGEASDGRGYPVDRAELHELAERWGLVPVTSVTKRGCDLLVAADPASQSGKAKKARGYGIPIASVVDFLAAGPCATVAIEAASVDRRFGIVCPRCGATRLSDGRAAAALCDDCRGG